MKKPIACVDFDGVIHRYSRGWQSGQIYDGIVEGFWEWAYEAHKYFRLVIYSSRSKTAAGRAEMGDWLYHRFMEWRDKQAVRHDLRVLYEMEAQDWLLDKDDVDGTLTLEMAHDKPAAFLTIDDRCVKFTGNWQALDLAPETLRQYRTWSQEVAIDDFGK